MEKKTDISVMENDMKQENGNDVETRFTSGLYNVYRPRINKPPPFKGPNIRIPSIIPIKGRGFINQGSRLGGIPPSNIKPPSALM